jgi:hypothetical protein
MTEQAVLAPEQCSNRTATCLIPMNPSMMDYLIRLIKHFDLIFNFFKKR